MLFVQGTRDEMADVSLIESTIEAMRGIATLQRVRDGDHSFRVRAASGRSQPQVFDEVLDAIDDWLDRLLER